MVKLYVESVRHFAEEYAKQIDVTGIKYRLNGLLTTVNSSPAHEAYVKLLLRKIDDGLLIATPSQINAVCEEFVKLKAARNKRFGSTNEPFKRLIENALDYEGARGIYRSYVPAMGIKTCAYCNAQYAVSFTSRDGKEYAQFEVDHWKSREKYPFLSISFYNYVPSCPSCNKHKGKNDLAYCLYSELPQVIGGSEYNPFVFAISDLSLSRFLNTFNTDLLKLEFKSSTSDDAIERDYARFAINEMYECFKDEAALSIRRFLFYSDAYREQMRHNYSSLFSDDCLYEEFIYGIPFSRGGALLRPLAKMIQDIRSQLENSKVYFDWMKRKGII